MTTFETTTDDRGVEYALKFLSFRDLPAGWAQCGTCGVAWNDDKVTSVTPVPSGRCPFEDDHEYDDEDDEGGCVACVTCSDCRTCPDTECTHIVLI
jgi:hypothetical protein